ncbi:MAG: hypothetical protein HC923_13510 [Myxococcales bacterium]|nr:hypothetical protein [Myxococcales bacterium]
MLADSIRLGFGSWLLGRGSALAEPAEPRFLLTVAALGGYSIQDAFLAVRESEAGSFAPTVNSFPDPWVESTGPFRAVAIPPGEEGFLGMPSFQPEFVRRNGDQMLVFTHRASSVNHQWPSSGC